MHEESESKLARFEKLVAGELVAAPGPFGGGPIKPIKPFTKVRTESMVEQLAGKSRGLQPGNGFPGGPDGSGLGTMFGRPLFQLLAKEKDTSITQAEFTEAFARLFQMWNTDKSGNLTFAQLRSGTEKDLPQQDRGFLLSEGLPRGNEVFLPMSRTQDQTAPNNDLGRIRNLER